MRLAVRFASQHLCAAEEEVSSAGIADGPAAVMAGQFKERATLRGQNVCILAGIVDVGLGFEPFEIIDSKEKLKLLKDFIKKQYEICLERR